MPNLDQALNALRSPQRPPALVSAAAALIFQQMRLDPSDPTWSGGDALLFSPSYCEVVQDAFNQAGCPADRLPQPGLQQLDAIAASGQRLYVLADSDDASRVTRIRGLHNQITVLSPDAPRDDHRWQTATVSDETSQALLSVFAQLGAIREKPVWVVSPLGGVRLFEARSTSSLPELAMRMKKLGTETAFDVLAQVNNLKAQGRDIISFGLGEPDFNTPVHIKDAALKAINENQTHYTPSAGIPKLRESIAAYIQRTRNIPCHADEVVVTPGAKPIMFDAVMALINPGDEVIYPNPGYPIYESVIDWVGGVSVPLPLLEDRNWNFTIEDLERVITPKTKCIVLNTPGNPCGNILEADLLRDMAELCVQNNLWVISDEVYSQILWTGEHHSIAAFPGMKERTVIVDGFSKTYAMTGWRMGYGVMNADLAKQVGKIETNIDSCTCAFTQIAGVHALDGPHHESNYMVEQFQERARVVAEGLNHIDGVSCLHSGGAFYVFPNVTAACKRLGMKTANDLQRALLNEAGVAVLPRTCFGRKNVGEEQEYLRLSFATSMENIREGLRRMKQFIER